VSDPSSTPTHLTLKQAAERLHVAKATLDNWRYLGKGPLFIRFGRVILYPIAEMEKWERAQLHSANSVQAASTWTTRLNR